jgi:hypothetical protein
MRLLHFVRRHPIALLGVFAVAFVVWLWRDSLPIGQPQLQEPGDTQLLVVRAPRLLPLPPGVEPEKAKPGAQETAQALTKLKPGMTRSEVEGLVGAPSADNILPVTVSDGKVTYQTAYEADFGPPATVRPITPRPHGPRAAPAGKERTRVTLEFDATKPGHPLLGIHYPDPLF